MSTQPSHSPDNGHDIAERAERRWAWFVIAIVVFMLVVVVYSGLHYAMMPPSRVETVDPSRLQMSGEFVESNLGTGVDPDGKVVVRFIAQQYSFTPQCIVVPADTPITFRVTSADLVHGFLIADTNINTMVEPGYVSTFKTSFPKTGEHLMPCHEYCGTGHEAMWARVQVIPANELLARAAKGERVSCVGQ